MANIDSEFAQYCCELLSGVGPCTAKRMFGGWGIGTDGMNIAILANLGDGDTLWLKVNDATRAEFEAAGCGPFTYEARGQRVSLGYYNVPADAMESPPLMLPWARLASQAALVARNSKAKPKPKTSTKTSAKAAKPKTAKPKTLAPKG
jgi:DNA transformation protein and related proteins